MDWRPGSGTASGDAVPYRAVATELGASRAAWRRIQLSVFRIAARKGRWDTRPAKLLVRMIGLEPTLSRGNWNLNPRHPLFPGFLTVQLLDSPIIDFHCHAHLSR